jgi:hypothetical protein
MTLPANIRVNTGVPFPSLVTSTAPVTVTKQNGIWTVGLSFNVLGQQVPPLADYPTDFFLMFDSVRQTFFKISLTTLIANIVPQNVPTIRMAASNATIAITNADVEVGIDTRTTAVTATLPSAAAWAVQNQNGVALTLVDIFGNAFANNITPSLNGADIFYTVGVPKILADYGVLAIRPAGSPVNGWYVKGID